MLTEQATKCPFCYTVYVEVEEKDKPPHLDISGGGKDKKGGQHHWHCYPMGRYGSF